MTASDPTQSPEPVTADLRSRILAYLVSNGEATAEEIAKAFGQDEESVDTCLLGLCQEREVYRSMDDLDGTTFCRSFRWQGGFAHTPIPGDFEGADQPLPGITILSFRSLPKDGDPLDDRHIMTPVGYMVEVKGIVHPRIYADAAKAILVGIALHHVEDREADWAATAFFRTIGRTYPAIRE